MSTPDSRKIFAARLTTSAASQYLKPHLNLAGYQILIGSGEGLEQVTLEQQLINRRLHVMREEAKDPRGTELPPTQRLN